MSDLSRLEALDGLAPPMPSSLSDGARAEAGRLAERRRGRRRRRLGTALAILAGCTAFAFTPPGKAATGWIAEVAGFGEEPTLPQVRVVPGSSNVVVAGQLADGTSYEVVAKRVPGGALCFGIDWVELESRGQGGACTNSHIHGRGNRPPLEASGVFFPPPESDVRSGPALFIGIADDRSIESLRVEVVAADGERDEIESAFVTLGPRAPANHGNYPVSVFAAPIDEEITEGVFDGEHRLMASAFDARGELVDKQQALLERERTRPPSPPEVIEQMPGR